MTDHQFYEAKKLIDGGMSISKAGKLVGVNYSTLYRRLHKDETPQAATEPEPLPESVPIIEAHPSLAAIDWDAICRLQRPPETHAEKTQREHDQWLIELKRRRRNG